MARRICAALCAVALAACGATAEYKQMHEYIDKCIAEVGPQNEHNNVIDYCNAKYRQSQRNAHE